MTTLELKQTNHDHLALDNFFTPSYPCSRPPVYHYEIDDRIVNYEPTGSHKDVQNREFNEKFDAHVPFGQSISSTVTRICTITVIHIIWTS